MNVVLWSLFLCLWCCGCACIGTAVKKSSPFYQELVSLVGAEKVDKVNPLAFFKVEELSSKKNV